MAKILIIEDYAADRKFLATLLRVSGHKPFEADDSAPALALLEVERPDLVLVDLLMPSMDGFEFTRLVRNDPRFAATPILFHTAAQLETEACILAAKLGVTHILRKPADPDLILRAIGEALHAKEIASPKYFGLASSGKSKSEMPASKVDSILPRLSAFIRLGEGMHSAANTRELMGKLCSGARDLIGAKYAAAVLCDADGARVEHFFVSGVDRTVQESMTKPNLREGILHHVLSSNRCLTSDSLRGDALEFFFPREKLHSFIGIPVGVPNKVHGLLFLVNKLGGVNFNDEDMTLLGALATQASATLVNTALYWKLRQSEEHFRSLFETANDVIFILNEAGIVKELNPAFERTLGWPRTDWIGRNFRDLLMPEELEVTQADIREVCSGREVPPRRYRVRCHLGRYKILEARMAVRSRERGKIEIMGISRDVTEQQELEMQLRQSQKMEAVGNLAGGIAHDFNNILAVILGYSERVLNDLDKQSPLHDPVSKILDSAERGAALTQKLLAFSRKEPIAPKVLSLDSIVADVEHMIRRLIGEKVELILQKKAGFRSIRADQAQIEQILLNLAVNAKDAMARGGKLTLTLASCRLDESAARVSPGARPGDYALLTVTDTGSGMSDEVKTHIFEPFFTTKAVGKGTGLGLATVYSIVRQCGGFILVESEIGKGTTFELYFPVERAQAIEVSADLFAQLPAGGTETILVVEDNDEVRAMIVEGLQRVGHVTLEARDGKDAIALARQSGRRIDLLICDFVLPGMNGDELFEEVRADHSGIRIIFTSGHSEETTLAKIRDAKLPFIQKPFSMAALTKLVRRVLDESPDAIEEAA